MSNCILCNGNVITLDPTRPRATAIAIRGGRIVAVGDRDDARQAMVGARAREIDLAGQTAVPGLIDSHVHLLEFGLSLDRLSLFDARSIADLTREVEVAARTRPAGGWVLGRGWDQDRLAERRYPTRADLDRAAPDHPVFLARACGHVTVANSLALRLAGVGADTADPPGGRIDRDEHGEPTGVLRENASSLVREAVPEPTYAELRDALGRAIRAAQAAGLCGAHSDDVRTGRSLAAVLRMYRELVGDERLRFRVQAHVDANFREQLWDAGLRTGDGDRWLRLGALKLFADGSLGGRTAALRVPYADDPGNRGLLIRPRDELFALVDEAHRQGMQVAVHAIGDRGADLAISAMQAAMDRTHRPDPRHRVIHCQVMAPDLIRTMAERRLVAEIQPKFITTDMAWADARVGPERARYSYAWKTLLEAGVPCAGGSDCPIEPIEPVLGIYSAVARQDLDGRPERGWHPEQRLSVAQALHLFTLGAAYCGFEEAARGSLAPGKLGDVTVFEADPTTLDPGALKELKVTLTVVGGEVVHGL